LSAELPTQPPSPSPSPSRSPLAGEVALVTGGTRGIGRAIALVLARSGASVAATYRSNREAASALDALAKSEGLPIVTIKADVTDHEVMRETGEAAAAEFGGPVDLLVNNAGVVRDAALYALEPSDWDEVVRTGLYGAYNASRGLVYGMMRRRRGRIVNVSSAAALRGLPGQAAYAAANSGLHGFTRSLARELARFSITVNAVAPGYIETEVTSSLPPKRREEIGREIPLGRMGTVEEVAALVRFLCASDAGYITGQVYAIDGGLTA
jgi:3-oxoacyl-[acyl-carrier protein] reductase